MGRDVLAAYNWLFSTPGSQARRASRISSPSTEGSELCLIGMIPVETSRACCPVSSMTPEGQGHRRSRARCERLRIGLNLGFAIMFDSDVERALRKALKPPVSSDNATFDLSDPAVAVVLDKALSHWVASLRQEEVGTPEQREHMAAIAEEARERIKKATREAEGHCDLRQAVCCRTITAVTRASWTLGFSHPTLTEQSALWHEP
jgi:hypothetical protein